MNFLTMNANVKLKKNWGGMRVAGASVSDLFFYKKSKLKKSKKKIPNLKFVFFGGRVGCGGLELGGITMNVQVMALTSSIYDHFII